MNRKYVPIIKCKKGEQKALEKLNAQVKDSIIPLIEIPLSPTTAKKSIGDIINSFWEGRQYYFYFTPEWYSELDNDSDIDFMQFATDKIIPLCSNGYGIPVIDLSLAGSISDWTRISCNGIGIRVRNNEFGDIEEALNPLFNSTGLKRQKTDLILDLQYVSSDDLFAKTSVLKAAFSDLDLPSEYHSIIISSVSFPKPLPPMESKKIYRFGRTETEIFANSLKLSDRFKFNYVYSDYGPSDIDDTPFVIGMSPNFKIKYTTLDNYIYIKGMAIKKGGLDIINVRNLAKILVESNEFMGKEYSWGDQCIFEISQNSTGATGNLTTWVSYAMNHHITFIINQI